MVPMAYMACAVDGALQQKLRTVTSQARKAYATAGAGRLILVMFMPRAGADCITSVQSAREQAMQLFWL